MEPAVELTPTSAATHHTKSIRLKDGEVGNIRDEGRSHGPDFVEDPEGLPDDTSLSNDGHTDEITSETRISPGKNLLYRFFYPKRRKTPDFYDPKQHNRRTEAKHDQTFVDSFWTTFDDILMLSIFTQVGILSRLAASTWFARFDDVFSHESALFVNLPLNCASCLCMGMLCSGNQLMEIVTTRFSPTGEVEHVQQPAHNDGLEPADDNEDSTKSHDLRRRRGRQRRSKFESEDIHNELRDVQLRALERRIRASKSLLLFPVSKKDVDVMEHYDHRFNDNNHMFDNDLVLSSNIQEEGNEMDDETIQDHRFRSRHEYDHVEDEHSLKQGPSVDPLRQRNDTQDGPTLKSHDNDDVSGDLDADSILETNEGSEHQPDLITEFTTNVQENVVENIETFRRVNRNNLLLRGWVKGTTPEDMSDDLLLGLRDGFCGAISSFSSWNSSMVNLLKHGQVTEALVGYMLGIQLPIIAYRFGQHIALYIFVWRTRREARSAERRGGYAIRVSIDEESDHTKTKVKEIPSLRAVFFAVFLLALSLQITSIYLFRDPDDQQLALSLLFSPLGVLARWRLRRLNDVRPWFPLGTFVANLLACALAGSLGTLLAGNPGPRERIALVSIIAGFGGTLSSLATFIVEVLNGVDPILLRFDGAIYAALSVGGAMVIAFASSSSVEWVDETVAAKAAGAAAAAAEAFTTNDDIFSNETFANGTDGMGNLFLS